MWHERACGGRFLPIGVCFYLFFGAGRGGGGGGAIANPGRPSTPLPSPFQFASLCFVCVGVFTLRFFWRVENGGDKLETLDLGFAISRLVGSVCVFVGVYLERPGCLPFRREGWIGAACMCVCV